MPMPGDVSETSDRPLYDDALDANNPQNFDKFNNPNNYRAQNTAYGYHRVSREYPRGDRGGISGRQTTSKSGETGKQ